MDHEPREVRSVCAFDHIVPIRHINVMNDISLLEKPPTRMTSLLSFESASMHAVTAQSRGIELQLFE
jgi:hypothetical protein